MEALRSSSLQRAVLAGLFAALVSVAAGPPTRIQAEIQNRQTFRLPGSVHPLLAAAQDQGEVPDTLALPRIAIHFKMTAAQEADLGSLLEAQQDPSSPQFHKWLTPEEYGDRFGLNPADLSRITAWLESMGFTNVQVARGRNMVTMSGVAAQVRYALQTSIHHYLVDGTLHYANAAEPALPVELQGMVAGIRGLHDFRPLPHTRPRPRFTSSLSHDHFLAPGDFATIYNLTPLYNSGINGSGQSIAIAGQTDIAVSDIEAFQSASGLPIKDPQIILDPPDPGSSSGDVQEADLDLEWSGAVARGANIIYVNSNDVFNSTTYAVNNVIAPIISLTYGLCETQFAPSDINSMNGVFQQANVEGITVLVAAGDFGAADCETLASPTVATHGLGVDFPASSPYVTGLGGTEFNEGSGTYWSATNGTNSGSALSYIPEIVWNDTTADLAAGGTFAATGGGVSVVFAKPSWQQGNGVPNDGHRDVPDVALAASVDHDAYLMCDSGWCTNGYRNSGTYLDTVGGTSAGAPTFAGIVALINQHTSATGGQGNINPRLYALAASSPSAFHDITVGNNIVPCAFGTPNCTTGTMGYSAGPGYDMVTGLGSVNASNLVVAWPATSAPAAPVLVSPGNGSTGVALSQTLSWQASTGATSYNVFFGTVNPPPQVTQTGATIYGPTLSAGTTYYWKVAAANSVGSSSSAIWSFTTAPPVVLPPAAPVLTSPANGATGVPLSPALTWQASSGATSYNVFFGTTSPPPQVTQTGATTYSPAALSSGVTYFWSVTAVNSGGSNGSAIWSFTTTTSSAGALLFVPVTPCRVADTRGAAGPFGGPTMAGGSNRSFAIPQSSCGIPATAQAYSLNVTVVPAGSLSYLTLWPTGQSQPLVSTLNSLGGAVTANAAIVPAGASGAVSVFVTNTTDVVLDIDGYFSNAGGAAFYAATPCRVADTRNPNGALGGPSLSGGQTRDFPVLSSNCGISASASAYSMNVTVVPAGHLSYLTTWPTGQPQPLVSTLNSFTGKVVANAALVPSGAGGAISVFVTDLTDVVLDANGYFAAGGNTGALSFYPVAPCRVADTRNAAGPFGGPSLAAGGTRSFPVPASTCSIPATAQAYSLNVTVVPAGPLSYLTAWPTGTSQPLVSTLNSFDGSIVANAAIVPAGTSGAVSVFVTNPTDVVLDVNGYFAP